jgi:hypothetical protein
MLTNGDDLLAHALQNCLKTRRDRWRRGIEKLLVHQFGQLLLAELARRLQAEQQPWPEWLCLPVSGFAVRQ